MMHVLEPRFGLMSTKAKSFYFSRISAFIMAVPIIIVGFGCAHVTTGINMDSEYFVENRQFWYDDENYIRQRGQNAIFCNIFSCNGLV
jgi:hypothetical protein